MTVQPDAQPRPPRKSGRSRADQSLRIWIEIVRFANQLQRDIDAKLRQSHGQSLARFDVLSQLERAGRPMTVGELSAQLLTSTGNITGLLDRMERDGLLTRTLSATDRRSFLVEATQTGLGLFREMARDNAGWVTDAFAHLEKRDFAAIADVFETRLPG